MIDFIIILKENIHKSKFQLGLLWEWTLDWYNGYDENIVNKDFGNIYKILRGGSFLSEKYSEDQKNSDSEDVLQPEVHTTVLELFLITTKIIRDVIYHKYLKGFKSFPCLITVIMKM